MSAEPATPSAGTRVETSERAETDLERLRREHREGLAVLKDHDDRVAAAKTRMTQPINLKAHRQGDER